MTYEQIKKHIEEDYGNVVQARIVINGRNNMKTFYLEFSEALEELHKAVGPFCLSKDQFIEQIRYLKEIVNPKVYEHMLDYCHNNLKLDI